MHETRVFKPETPNQNDPEGDKVGFHRNLQKPAADVFSCKVYAM